MIISDGRSPLPKQRGFFIAIGILAYPYGYGYIKLKDKWLWIRSCENDRSDGLPDM